MCALRRENRVGSIQPPCTAAKGMYLVGARKQELPGATLLGNAVDVTWKRNGDEYAWSFLRISRVFDISSTKRRCRGLHRLRTDRCQTRRAAKKRLDGHGAFRCGHFLRSILALAEIRGGTRGNFEREVQGKTHSLPPPGNSDQSELLPKADIGSGGGHVGFGPKSRLGRFNQFARFQITSTTSPADGRTVSVSYSPAIAIKRFWSVPFQFGKELPTT